MPVELSQNGRVMLGPEGKVATGSGCCCACSFIPTGLSIQVDVSFSFPDGVGGCRGHSGNASASGSFTRAAGATTGPDEFAIETNNCIMIGPNDNGGFGGPAARFELLTTPISAGCTYTGTPSLSHLNPRVNIILGTGAAIADGELAAPCDPPNCSNAIFLPTFTPTVSFGTWDGTPATLSATSNHSGPTGDWSITLTLVFT